jgi:hypothetical protein
MYISVFHPPGVQAMALQNLGKDRQAQALTCPSGNPPVLVSGIDP